MRDLAGKTAVITGGASGIGLGMARSFGSRGAKLVLADLNLNSLAVVKQEFDDQGLEVVTQLCDVSSLDQVEELAVFAQKSFGSIDVVCSNAGVGVPTSARDIKLDDWEWIINIDLWGPIYAVKVFLPLLEEQEWGHINATSSMAGLISSQMMGAYNIAKHGVVALMAATERELRSKKTNVHASVLCPGPINTNISQHSVDYRPGRDKPKADLERAGKLATNIQAMLEQGMDPDEVGELVAEAIEQDKFWILTHPLWSKAVQNQLDALKEDQSLTRA